jgi:hypothetical protein
MSTSHDAMRTRVCVPRSAGILLMGGPEPLVVCPVLLATGSVVRSEFVLVSTSNYRKQGVKAERICSAAHSGAQPRCNDVKYLFKPVEKRKRIQGVRRKSDDHVAMLLVASRSHSMLTVCDVCGVLLDNFSFLCWSSCVSTSTADPLRDPEPRRLQEPGVGHVRCLRRGQGMLGYMPALWCQLHDASLIQVYMSIADTKVYSFAFACRS